MIRAGNFLLWLEKEGLSHIVGVPDSLLRELLAEVEFSWPRGNHIIAANEGGAVGHAIGVFLETGKPAVVYMQNSGLGNAVNPLTSLAHSAIYGTPVVLLIGWRGEPGKPDEPQHLVQGAITLRLLDAMNIPYEILSSQEVQAQSQLNKLVRISVENGGPVALVVPAGVFQASPRGPTVLEEPSNGMTREEALGLVLNQIPQTARVIATTGMLGRELWEQRSLRKQSHSNDFLTVGGMGHSSAIALGIAESSKAREVWCLDGDGALIMHLGTSAVIGNRKPSNLKHIIFNNFSHDSVGGQPTSMNTIDLPRFAESVGYYWVGRAKEPDEVLSLTTALKDSPALSMAEITIRRGSRSGLSRPPNTIFRRGVRFPQ